MKKIIIALVVLSTALTGCKKDEPNIPTYPSKINFFNVSKTGVVFIDGTVNDQSVTFEMLTSVAAPKDIAVTLKINSESTATATTQYEFSASQFTIPAGSYRANGSITFHNNGFNVDESKNLSFSLTSADIVNGINDTIVINAVKVENPLIASFPGDYKGNYWDKGVAGVGDFDDDSWWDSPITLTFDDSDPKEKTMIMNNLWWGGVDTKITFDFDENTIHMDGGQIVDPAWEVDGFVLPWKIKEVNGTFDPTTKKLVFDYDVVDANGLLYGSYSCWVLPDTKK